MAYKICHLIGSSVFFFPTFRVRASVFVCFYLSFQIFVFLSYIIEFYTYVLCILYIMCEFVEVANGKRICRAVVYRPICEVEDGRHFHLST